MSYVMAAPEMMTSAATDLATIGSNVSAAHMAAAAPTLALLPAAADEVSASIAQLFSEHAADYQALAAQAAAFNERFVQNLTASAGWYASIETAINAYLNDLVNSAGGYLIGGLGAPGLLPTIAWQILISLWTDPLYGIAFFPFEVPLLPFAILYLGETMIVVNGGGA
jgi:PE family